MLNGLGHPGAPLLMLGGGSFPCLGKRSYRSMLVCAPKLPDLVSTHLCRFPSPSLLCHIHAGVCPVSRINLALCTSFYSFYLQCAPSTRLDCLQLTSSTERQYCLFLCKYDPLIFSQLLLLTFKSFYGLRVSCSTT